MNEDHLSNEVSISGELTDSGVKASAKSRAVSAFDRLVGSAVDTGSAWLEGVAERRRAKNAGEKALIEAAARYGINKMEGEAEFAHRAFENHFKKVAGQQLNKDAVAAEAIEDLRASPPSDQLASAGPNTLGEDFMSRFESYAETASSDEMRARWGRVLAGEIRRPGTFTRKVMRATDELDAEIASFYEGLMRYRVGDALVKALVPEFPYQTLLRLVASGLINDPGMGQNKRFVEGSVGGQPVLMSQFGQLTMTIPKEPALVDDGNTIAANHGFPGFPVYILTDVGFALSSILPSFEEEVGKEFASKLKAGPGREADIAMWRLNQNGMHDRVPFSQPAPPS